MPMFATVTRFQKGPNLKLIFSITSDGIEHQYCTGEYTIDDLAKVNFNFCHTKSNNHKVQISRRSMDKEVQVKVNVTCERLKYFRDLVCSEEWSEWSVMGEVSKDKDKDKDNLFATHKHPCVRSVFDLNIIVNKVDTARFANLYNDTEFTDFHLSTTDGKVAVHKAYLGAHSDVFKRMLTSKWKETTEGCIEMKDVSLQTLQHLKAYLYLGILPNDNELRPLLLLASQYMIQNLKEVCITKLAQTVKPEDFKCLVDFAVDNKMTDLILAITQLTSDEVIDGAHKINKRNV